MGYALTRDLISARYQGNAISLRPLNPLQKEYIAKFLSDGRIKYETKQICPLCCYGRFILIAEKDRYGIPLKTVVCERCGLVFSLEIMDEKSAGLFYAEYYRKIYAGVERPSQDTLDKKFESGRHGKIPAFLKKGDVVVEMGTGCGWNLMKYKLAGLDHYGFDFDEHYIKFGREKYGLNLHNGGAREAQGLKVKADYLLVLQVLEHTYDPLEFMRQLGGIIKENAIINIQVPSLNFLFFGGGATGYDLLGTLQNAHNFLFDESTFKLLALKSGYEINSLLGGHAILRKSSRPDAALNHLEQNLSKGCRGPNVVRYLKSMENQIQIKNRLIPQKIRPHFHYGYYALKPWDVAKKYFIFRVKRKTPS